MPAAIAEPEPVTILAAPPPSLIVSVAGPVFAAVAVSLRLNPVRETGTGRIVAVSAFAVPPAVAEIHVFD